jgi:hypothetical protein
MAIFFTGRNSLTNNFYLRREKCEFFTEFPAKRAHNNPRIETAIITPTSKIEGVK